MLYGYFEGQPLTICGMQTFKCYPRWLHHGEPHRFLTGERNVEVFESFHHFCETRQPRTVCFIRNFALGDILMLLPIAKCVRRLFDLEPIGIVVRGAYFDELRQWSQSQEDFYFLQNRTGQQWDFGVDVHIDLNACLEIDHHGGHASDFHRCVLYGHALGLEVTTA